MRHKQRRHARLRWQQQQQQQWGGVRQWEVVYQQQQPGHRGGNATAGLRAPSTMGVHLCLQSMAKLA